MTLCFPTFDIHGEQKASTHGMLGGLVAGLKDFVEPAVSADTFVTSMCREVNVFAKIMACSTGQGWVIHGGALAEMLHAEARGTQLKIREA